MILLVRHGRTEFNEAGRYQGARDSSLTALGINQARNLGLLVSDLVQGEVLLWSSPLGRAIATAKIIKQTAALTCDLTLDDRLREVSLGGWDGLTDEEIEDVSPGACDGATRFDWFFRSPDGEGYEEAELRVRDWLDEVAQQPGCHVVVSHGLIGRILRGAYSGLPQCEALRLEVPQDMVFRLANGKCEPFGPLG
jgi:probable phosphoglycerate mutase